MAEAILYGPATKILEGLGSLLLQEVKLASGVEKELKKLKDSLSTINARLMHAETMGAMNDAVKNWLREHKEIAYDIEDVLDEFATEALRQNVELLKYNVVVKQVRRCFSHSNPIAFRLKMAHKIKDIRERFSDIQMNDGVAKTQFENHFVDLNIEDSIGRHTDPLVLESEVLGRVDDREKLVKLLSTSSGGSSCINEEENNNVTVIPIIGIGGLGKTTLARYVFSDPRVKSHFEYQKWVCVSFDFKALINEVESEHARELSGRKYLLVLDDVWNEKHGEWEILQKFLISGVSRGSKILVTTRSQEVASIMQPNENHHYTLGGLSKDHCESLFLKRAFGKRSEEIIRHPKLVKIGNDIVKKCGGVPLAAKALGGLLHHTRDEKDWLDVLYTEIWNLENEDEILPALRISYNRLPSYLKQCFAYCSVFPQDHYINVPNLIHQWMAHGFIKPPPPNSGGSSSNRTLEDSGHRYFRELLWRSFFEEVYEDNLGNILTCKMHDLVHNLARWVAGREWLEVHYSSSLEKVVVNGRHMLLNLDQTDHLITPSEDQPDHLITPSFENAQKLRSLHWSSEDPDHLDYKFITGLISPFRGLRLLNLSGLGMREVPKCIGYQLQQLRYLDLSDNPFEALPNSVCRLYNLQTLRLMDCEEFKEWPRSSDMTKLISLRHLVLLGDFMSYMPRGLGQLTSLQTLNYFYVGDPDVVPHDNRRRRRRRSKEKKVGGLGELRGLNQLRGKLEIVGLENVREARDAEEANLKDKSQLQALSFTWCTDDSILVAETEWDTRLLSKEEEEEQDLLVLGNLQPHPNLEALQIDRYRGIRMPCWMIDSYSQFPNLVHLSLEGCPNLKSLPLIGEFPCLKHLDLAYLEALESICHEVEVVAMGGGTSLMVLFPALETLEFRQMKSLERWTVSVVEQGQSQPNDHFHLFSSIKMFPRLTELTLFDCNALTTLTTMPMFSMEGIQHLTSLREMKLSGLERLISLLPADCPAPATLVELRIEKCPSLQSLPGGFFVNLNLLSKFTISCCDKLSSLPEEIRHLVTLKSLVIESCPELTTLTEALGCLSSLEKLSISECSKLTSLPDCPAPATLEELHIFDCWSLVSLPRCFFVNLNSLLSEFTIDGCDKLPSLPEEIGHLVALKSLVIKSCLELTALPEALGCLLSLKLLHIFECSKLASLPKGIQRLSALEELRIWGCPCLTTLPDGLQTLASRGGIEIEDCPNLTFPGH